ncbi:MAG: autotransporter-associated beta strand repeat-containing protein, partial [Phycisphaerales bacterium]|nr:autotransporter-associated beta strand repeat-containing protein [Phycisphaerales bacterium]
MTLLAAVAAGGVCSAALGQISATWISAVSGSWSVNSNWTGGAFPSGGGAATFSVAGTVTVTLDTSVTLSSINFTTGSYTIAAGGGAFTMTGPALLNATTGTSTINANISTAGILTKAGGGTLILNGTNTMAGLNVGQGTLVVNTALPANIPLTIGGFTAASGNLILGSNPASFTSITMPYNNAGTTSGTISTSAELTLNGSVTYTPNYGSIGSSPLQLIGGGSLNLGSSNRTFDIQYHNNASGDVQVGLNIVGSGGIVKTNTGSLALSNATNSFSGGVNVLAGALMVGADSTGAPNAPTAGPAGTGVITMADQTSLRGVTSTRVVHNTINANGAIVIGSVSIAGTINMPTSIHSISGTGTSVITGLINPTGAQPVLFGDLTGGALSPFLPGTISIQSNPGYTQATVLNSGTLNLATVTGSLINSESYTLHGGTMTVTTATVANRFNDSGTMTLSGGALVFSGSVAAGGYQEDMGPLRFVNANSYLAATSSGSTSIAKLTFGNVSRANRATGTVAATSLGQAGSFASPSGTTAYIKISNAANEAAFVASLVGGGGAYSGTSLNNSIVPWLAGSTSGTGTPSTFLTYEGTGGTGGGNTGPGFIALATTNYDTAIPAASAVNNVRITANQTPAADTTINSLVLAGGSLLGSAEVTITSGAIIGASSGTLSAAIRTPGEMIISNSTVTTAALGTITAGSGLTKGGTGTLILGGNNASTLVGDIILNGGTLSFSADTHLGAAGNNVSMYQNSALLYTGPDLTFGRTLTIANTNSASNNTPNVANAALSIINVSVATTTLSMTNPIAGASPGGLLKLGSGTLVTGIAPSMSGLTAVAGGVLSLTGNNTAAPGSIEISSGGTLRVTANNNFTGGKIVLNAGTLLVDASTTISRDFRLQASATINTGANNVTFSGNILPGEVAGVARPATFAKFGTGTATFSGTISAPFGQYVVSAGTSVHSGAGGTVLNAGSVTVNSGGRLVLDNTTLNSDRFGDTTTLTLNGSGSGTLGPAEFRFRGNAITTATETLGALTFTAGGTVSDPGQIVTVDPNGSTGGTVITFASLAPSLSFTLFRGPNLGVDPSTLPPGTPYTQIFFTTPPTLSGGGFISGALYDNTLTGLGIGSATYSNTFGIQLFTVGTFTGNRINNGPPENVPTDVIFHTSGATTFVGNAATILGLTVNTNTPTVTLDPATTSGSLNITGGGLTVVAGNSTGVTFGPGSGVASLNLGAAGSLNISSSTTFNIPLAGSAGYTKGGSAAATFNVANTITGPLTVTAGTLAFNNSATNTVTALSGSGGTIHLGAGANLRATGSGTYSGSITGAGSLVIASTTTSTLTLNSANSYTGGTAVGDGAGTLGILQLGHPDAAGTGPITFGNTTARNILRTTFATGTVPNDMVFSATGSGSLSQSTTASDQVVTLSGALSGGASSTSLSFTGNTNDSGVWVLTGNNSGLNVGTIIIDEGQLAVTSNAAFGNAGTIDLFTLTTIGSGSLGGLRLDGSMTITPVINVRNSNVINTQANHGTLAGNIVGSSQLAKAGSGVLTITSTGNTHTGTITVLAGELNVRGNVASSTSPVQIQGGATLSGDGTLVRPISVAAGGIVSPGNSVGVLTVGSMSVSTATFAYESNGITLDRIDMAGALSLAGTSVLNLTGAPLPAGSYTLMNYGTFGGGGTIALGTTLGGAFTYNLLFNPTNLVLNIDVIAASFTWDADPATPGVQDGSGTWFTGGPANFFNNDTSTNEPWANSFTRNVTLGSSSGGFTVTIDSPVQANRVIFAQPYRLTGAGITLRSGILANANGTLSSNLTMESSNTLEVASGATFRVEGSIGEGTSGLSLNKTGAGTLVLTAPAGYTGPTGLNAGTTVISAANQLGGATIAITSATLLSTASLVGAQTISLSGATSAISVATATSHTRSAPIVGSGALNKLGGGTLVLTTPATYSGGTSIAEGTLAVAGGGALPAAGVLSIAAGAALNLNNSATNTVGTISGAAGSTISIGTASSLNIAPASGTLTVNSAVIGPGSLSFNPVASGTLVLGAANSFAGGLNVGTIGTVLI